MRKVGIMSMQRIANYGSFLQAYGLKHILEELGCEVQFVDYHPGETLITANGGKGIKRKISKVIDAFNYDAPIKEKIKYIMYKKNYATNYYPYLKLGEMNYSPELDVLVIGSDEVFNCVQDNTNVGFSPELFGEGNKAKKIVTYAASFGNTTMEKLEKYGVKNKVEALINKISSISVRDKNSGWIVSELTGKEPLYNLDPVLVYDFIGKCVDIIPIHVKGKYMILYGYSGRFSKEECKEIRIYADLRGLKVFCIGGVQNVCDKFIDCNPFQVIAYFQCAECVVTDTFHGTIFSVITHRQFVSKVRCEGYGNSEKLIDLLSRLKLESRIVNDLGQLEDKIQERIDYREIDEIIEKERYRSYEYLRQEIENV